MQNNYSEEVFDEKKQNKTKWEKLQIKRTQSEKSKEFINKIWIKRIVKTQQRNICMPHSNVIMLLVTLHKAN